MAQLYIWGDILADLTKLLGLGVIPDERLQAAVDAFNEKNKGFESWQYTTKVAVILNKWG